VTTPEIVAEHVASGEVVCWFNGRSEWGPRALGNRSIVADPRQEGIKARLNCTVKYREPFRPFGLSGTASGLSSTVDMHDLPAALSPYMLTVAPVIRDDLPEVTHHDGSVRFQVVDRKLQPEWHRLIEAFGERTGLYAVLNTSFNTLGEPLVETPEDAVRQFLLTGADGLYLDGRFLSVTDVPAEALAAARRLARERTPIDVLAAALSIEAAGYPVPAGELLDEWQFTADEAVAGGIGALRRYQAFMARIAAAEGRHDDARTHARAVLTTATFDRDAGEAASAIAESDGDDLLAELVQIISYGRGADFWRHLLGEATLTGGGS
jgi:carbamoyltransferase